MSKKISSLITAAVVAIFMLMSSFTVVYADSYKNWLQSDSRWSGKTLGGSGETMREIGCAVTSVAIQVVHSGSMSESNFNPGTLVDYLNKSGGLDSGGNLYWGAVTGLVSSFTFEKRAYFASQTKTNIIKELTNYINSGYYVVMSVEYDCHWVAVDTISNGVVYMMDPAQNKTNKLFDYYSVGGMLQVRLFKGKKAPAKVGTGSNPAPVPPSTTTPQVTTTASGTTYLTGHYLTTDPLNLRESYSTSSEKILTIPENTTIVVTRIYNNSWGETEYDGKTGWVYMGYTQYTESSYTYTSGTYKCTSDTGVNMRSGIGTDKSVVCLIPYNATVTISSVSHNWGKAEYGSYTGYICMDYLEYVAGGTETTTTAVTTTTAKPTTTTTTKATTTTTTKAATTTTTKATTTTTTKATTTTTTKATTTTTTKATTTTTAKPTTTTTTKATTTATTKATTAAATTKATTAAATTKATTAAATTQKQTTSAITTVSTTGTVPNTTASVIKGDVNRDGKLDKDDVLKLNLFIIKPTKLDVLTKYIYDINNDGTVNEIDVVYLMKAIRKQQYLNTKNKSV